MNSNRAALPDGQGYPTIAAHKARRLAAIVFAFWATASASEPFTQGLLWRLDKPGVPTSWVFGTLHSNDPRVTTLPDPVARAFARARTFALEIYWSDLQDEQFYEAMQFDDGRRLTTLIGAELYARVRQELGNAAPPEPALARSKPWAALLRVAAARGTSDAPTLDRSLFFAARERRMTIVGLELLDEQVAAFDTIPVATQIALLRHTLEHRAELEAQVEPTVRAWLRRDLAALARIDRAAGGNDPEIRRHYAVLTQQLVVNRSVLMAHRLFLPLRHGNVFVAVGALHLYGTHGLLELLQAQGYRVRRVY
jgi:hypothetical protein